MGDEIGGEADADEWRGEGRGVRSKGAGGIEQGLVARAARHVKFSVESRRAEQDEGMNGVGDAEHVLPQMQSSGDLAQHGAVNLFGTGNLRGAEGAGLRHGGVNEGELRRADAAGRIVGSVFDAEGVGGFEGR